MKTINPAIAALFLTLLAIPALLRAQVKTGITPFQTYGAGGVDSVNLIDLNLHIHIPVVDNKGRGLPFQYSLDFDGTIWQPVTVNGQTVWAGPSDAWGWTGVSSGNGGTLTYTDTQEVCYDEYYQPYYYDDYSNFVWVDSAGISHAFSGAETYDPPPDCAAMNVYPQPDATGWSDDSTGLILSVTNFTSGQVAGPAGRVYTPGPGSAVVDANGNVLTETDGSGYREWTDTLSNTVTETDASYGPTYVSYPTPDGGEQLKIQYTPQQVSSANLSCATGSSPGAWGPSTEYLPTAILFPDGSGYHMTYDSAGVLTSLQLPTGGTITYNFENGYGSLDWINCSDGSWYSTTRTASGNTWGYSRWPGSTSGEWISSAGYTVGGVNTAVDITSMGGYMTERDLYTAQNQDTPQVLDSVCYDGAVAPCTTTPVPQNSITEVSDTHSLGWTAGSLESNTTTYYNSNGLPTEQDDYALGVGAPGALLRRVRTTYAVLGNVRDKPAEIVVDSGSGTTAVADTKFFYDQASVTASGAPQLQSVSGARGNLTEVDTYTGASSYLAQHFTYFDTGTVQTATAVNSGVTNYAYGSASCGYAFPTTVTNPDGTTTQAAWNCAGAVPTSTTDENSQTTSYLYADLSTAGWQWRPYSISRPDGTTTTINYQPLQVESATVFNNGNSTQDDVTCYDSWGRPYLQQRREGPGSGNYDTVETMFDGLGRETEVTAPAVTGLCSAPASPVAARTTAYDGRNRPTQATDAAGGTVTYTYNQNDVLSVLGPAPSGENTKQKQTEFDALGRVSSVCEITGAADKVGCGQTNGESGYFTTYAYDPAGRVIQSQESTSNATQTRTFTFDEAGRMLSQSNPESGTTSYIYDSDGACVTTANDNGSLVARTDPAGNVTCSLHDATGRLTEHTFSAAAGFTAPPTAYFHYGPVTVDGQSMQNAAGRLSEAYTSAGSDEGFSFDAMGRVTNVYEKTPSLGSYYEVGEQYAANGAPTQITNSGLAGLPTITYGLDGEGRWSTVSGGSQNPVTATSYNVFGEPTEVDLGSGDKDVYGYDSALGRMTGYTFDVGSHSLAATIGWNANGTMSSLDTTDGLGGPTPVNCGFTHDDLARLTGESCNQLWSQSFAMGGFGNVSTSGTQNFAATYNRANNHINDLGVTYDADGDVIADPQHSYGWYSNGRPASVDGVTASYDALGRMVELDHSGTYDQIVYGPSGRIAVAQDFSALEATIPLPGGGAAVYNAGGLAFYRHANWQGTALVGSTPSQSVAFDQFFGPYGALPTGQGATDQSWSGIDNTHAAGISNLYDAQMREFEDIAGRFPNPDPAGAASMTVGDPQSLNRYAYTEGEPLLSTDPSGEFSITEGAGDGLAFVANPWLGVGVGLAEFFGGLFGGHPAINTAHAAATDQVHDYSGVNWNGALQGEVDGMPVGMSVPQANPFTFGTPGFGQACDFGSCSQWTGQGGVDVSVTIPVLKINWDLFVGVAFDLRGHLAVYKGMGFGVGTTVGGASGSAGVQLGGSNADTVCGLSGPFVQASGTASTDTGVSGSLAVFHSVKGTPVTGGTVGIGVGAGESAGLSATETKVKMLGGGQCK